MSGSFPSHRLLLVVLALLSLFARPASAQDDGFAQANEEYAAGRFQEAIDLYGTLVDRGQTSAALFYNLGNAWYRTGDLGQAILNYERALVLDPRQPETEANLRLVRDKARALELRQGRIERALGRATPMQLAIAAAVSFWFAAFALVGLISSRRRRFSTLSAGLVVSLLFLATSVYALHILETGSAGRFLAIVTAKSTDARVATADSASTVLTLPPGTQIKILSTRGDWIYAALPNNLRGWIPARDAERVRL